MTVAVSGTSIGGVFHDRTPRRFDRLDLAVDGPVEPGPALVLPLRAADTVAGVLVALRSADEQPFSDKQLDMMAAFADQAALAWRLATAQRQMREVEILTDRDRIARDLHDHVIQRLFAVGLTLQGAAPRARVPAVRESIYSSIDDLQEIIQEIRSAIFDLHAGPSRATGLRHRLDKVIDQLAIPALHTTVQYTGPLSVVDTVLANHAEAVLREAVSNAVRHANATSLAINVSVEDDVRVEVVDDGVGISGDITESGLRNLRQRADDAGGEFTVENMPTGGKQDGITRAARLMVALQRRISEDNPGVGRHAMAVAIPRERTMPAVLSNLDAPSLNTMNSNFCYFDDAGFNYKQLGPHMAGGGWAWADFVAEADPSNPDMQKVGGRVLKCPQPPPQAESTGC